MIILGIETSCDETAASVVRDGTEVLSSVVASQIEKHAGYGGVVPELAAREHLEAMVPVVRAALRESGNTCSDLDAVAVTHAPGLIPALDVLIESYLRRDQMSFASEAILQRLAAVGRDAKNTEFLQRLGQENLSPQEVLTSMRADPTRTAVLLLAVFGMLAFRSALGRSDLKHLIDPLPAAAVLLVVGADRLFAAWRRGSMTNPLAAWRVVALALLVGHVGFTLVSTPLRGLRTTLSHASLLRSGRAAVGDPLVTQVARWVQLETEVDEPVLFLPNNGAYYYLANRPSPIRFVMGHQMVTQAHRDEVLAQLRADPPRYFVWDEAAEFALLVR